MKILTVVTVIFMPLTLITGIYGMNFEYIPELKKKDGYFMLLGFMSFVVFGLLIVFRKVKWI
jgi:magnesium transporter